jgi:gamma-glutamylcyclotransferase (GGCT)/AIG2-like uncharacterized protein YtfP
VLYVGIIAAIQEHAYDHCRGNVFGHVYIYLNALVHALKSFASIEYGCGIRSKRQGDSKTGLGKSRNGSTAFFYFNYSTKADKKSYIDLTNWSHQTKVSKHHQNSTKLEE